MEIKIRLRNLTLIRIKDILINNLTKIQTLMHKTQAHIMIKRLIQRGLQVKMKAIISKELPIKMFSEIQVLILDKIS